jgi:antitoxin component YwqK of YwqJK toxin-antitoxin module
MRHLIVLLFLITNSAFSQKSYFKEITSNKKIVSEGWINNSQKTDYWFYYYANGNTKEEGHYVENKKINWWIFYDTKGNILKKCEFKNDKMNGFCIIYNDGEIIRAEKFIKGKKIKQWESLSEFKKDNTISMIND